MKSNFPTAFAAGRCDSLLHLAVRIQILPLYFAAGSPMMQWGVKSYSRMMQRGVKSYRRMMQRGVKSYRRMMQRGVNLAARSPV